MKDHKGKVYEYTAFFEANEHGGYTVVVPALPGLVTEGKNLEHARRMAKDAVRCYIEGLGRPGSWQDFFELMKTIRGLVDLGVAIQRLRGTSFRASDRLLDWLVARDRQRKKAETP